MICIIFLIRPPLYFRMRVALNISVVSKSASKIVVYIPSFPLDRFSSVPLERPSSKAVSFAVFGRFPLINFTLINFQTFRSYFTSLLADERGGPSCSKRRDDHAEAEAAIVFILYSYFPLECGYEFECRAEINLSQLLMRTTVTFSQ